jgi:hypothetical protein
MPAEEGAVVVEAEQLPLWLLAQGYRAEVPAAQ